MNHTFDPAHLRAAYDHCRLVPFIGSGMSRPACADWAGFVASLERAAWGAAAATSGNACGTGLAERAFTALQDLRRMNAPLADTVRQAVYADPTASIPASSMALAQFHWPLVCSTNYDELWLRACAALMQTKLDRYRWPRIRVLGRCESDCRFLLQHLAFPAQSVLWCLQGFLAPRTRDAQDMLDAGTLTAQLESELVIGHTEYRKATYQAPHFRRAFAEVFRSRSLLFLGSGLTEAYFRFLFDEIVELAGPPARPHFAFVPEGAVDPEFMLREYHILCYPYPAGCHHVVTERLHAFRACLSGDRVRMSGWSFTEHSRDLAARVSRGSFHVVNDMLPGVGSLPEDEVVAVSCGRGRGGGHGVPLLGHIGRAAIADQAAYRWQEDSEWIVRWPADPRMFGIVARDPSERGTDARTPQAILDAFVAFLNFARMKGFRAVHTQLLAAGRHRVFAPWVSMVQMARAYGDWLHALPAHADRVAAYVYVVDRDLLALMQGGFLDLAQPLQGGTFGINVDTYDAGGVCARHHELVSGDDRAGSLPELRRHAAHAYLSVQPRPRRDAQPIRCNRDTMQLSFRNLGLVPGSTLVIDFRRSGRK